MFRGSTKEMFGKSNVAHMDEKKMVIKRRWIFTLGKATIFTFGKATRLQRVFLSSPSESSVASLRFSKEMRSSRLIIMMFIMIIMVMMIMMIMMIINIMQCLR